MRAAGLLLLVVGLVLVGVNVYGVWASPAQDVPERTFKPPPGKREWLTAPLQQRRGEPDERYFRRLTMSMHYRITPSAEKYVVPVHENWLLFGARYVVPSYRDYEYADYRRAVERGAGLCTQDATAIFDVLKRQGFKRRIFGFPHHTMVEAKTRNGRTFVLDGHYGVFMPLSIAQIRRDPAVVRPYYGALDPDRSPVPRSSAKARAAVGTRIYRDAPWFVLSSDSTPERALAERVAYALKWPLPLVLCLAGGALLAWQARRRLAPGSP